MKRRIRILHIIQNLNYGGMERLLADVVRGVDRDRFESHVLVLQYLGRFAEGLDDVARLHQAEPLPAWSMLWPAALARQVREIAPDIVHSHSGVWYKSARAARQAGVRTIIHTDHGRPRPDPWQSRFVDRLASRRTDIVVAVSDALARQLADTVVADPRRIRVVMNGVDTEAFRPRQDDGAVRRALGVGAATPILGSVGRLEPIKGYDVMVEAFAALRARWTPPDGDAPVLVLGGEGSERPRLERLAAERGVSDGIRFLGWRDDIHDLHAAFTLFTMSSRSEGTSVSLLEAMSAGLCPVVTDVGGNGAVLGAALRHRLVPGESPAELAAAWRDALRNTARRRSDAAAARARVCAEFSLGATIRHYQELYGERSS